MAVDDIVTGKGCGAVNRTAINELYRWKERKRRKPLIIRGARQVGKTWLMQEFGRVAFSHTVYINFENNQAMKSLFSGDFEIKRLITGLELYSGHKIDPDNTLMLFDEIKEEPKALTSLKYFYENAPEYKIICAGSLLGVALHPGTSFPVGKVEFLDLFPLSFNEFLSAVGYEKYNKLLEDGDFDLASDFRNKFIEQLKYYYYVGGMPEAVSSFATERDFEEVREIQSQILSAYEQDFSKHAPPDLVPRIRMLWESIPGQLSKENKKFIYGLVKEGARAREYEMALLWLNDCGLAHKVQRVNSPKLPLKAYEDLKAFKIFILDVGLLSCMAGLKRRTLIEGNRLFTEFKGALTEQFVLQQLKTFKGLGINYWTNDRGTAEIDFLVDNGEDIFPVEVKAEQNLKAKSLKAYRERFAPPLSLRISLADYKAEEGLVNVPLYGVNGFFRGLKK